MTLRSIRRITFSAGLCAAAGLVNGCTKTITQPDVALCGNTRGAPTPLKHDPILFVHGYGGAKENFCTMIAVFRSDGWSDNELYAYDYSVVNSFATDAEEIRSQVNAILTRTGATKVDIIAHSAGSVSSRYYIKNLGGDSKGGRVGVTCRSQSWDGRREQLLIHSVRRAPTRLSISCSVEFG